MKKNQLSLWVIKDIKADGRIEIEKPYYGTTKFVISKKLQPFKCEKKNHTRRTNHEPVLIKGRAIRH